MHSTRHTPETSHSFKLKRDVAGMIEAFFVWITAIMLILFVLSIVIEAAEYQQWFPAGILIILEALPIYLIASAHDVWYEAHSGALVGTMHNS